MKNLIKNKAFILGFLSGIFILAWKSVYPIYVNEICHSYLTDFDFTLFFYKQVCGSVSRIWWALFLTDIFTTLIFGSIVGLTFKFIWSNISSRRIKLK